MSNHANVSIFNIIIIQYSIEIDINQPSIFISENTIMCENTLILSNVMSINSLIINIEMTYKCINQCLINENEEMKKEAIRRKRNGEESNDESNENMKKEMKGGVMAKIINNISNGNDIKWQCVWLASVIIYYYCQYCLKLIEI